MGATEWARREKEFDNTEELEAFAGRKVSELDKYDEILEKMEESKALVDSGNMTKKGIHSQRSNRARLYPLLLVIRDKQ